MVPFAENLDFWALMFVAAIAAWFMGRKRARARFASASQFAPQTTGQRRLYWMSMSTLIVPMGYVLGVDGTHFWPAAIVLGVQSGCLLILQRAKVGYRIRLWLIPPIAVPAILAGAVASGWPAVDSATLRAAPWVLLSAFGIAYAVGCVLSIFAFPVGHGERAH